MKKVFADADYLVALLNPMEQLNQKAKAVSRALGQSRMITSEMVLAEVLAFYAESGPSLRSAAVNVALKLANDPNTTVIPQTSIQFREAVSLYHQRTDKSWSLTDCASFIIMREEGATDALTHDHHFEQAGFKALLRSPD
jgi:predicted nucleic acid-binding protein